MYLYMYTYLYMYICIYTDIVFAHPIGGAI